MLMKLLDGSKVIMTTMLETNLRRHFETEDLPLSKEQEEEVERMSQEIEELYRKIALQEQKKRGEVYYDKIDELESEIEDIRLDPEGEPTEEMYDEKVKDYFI